MAVPTTTRRPAAVKGLVTLPVPDRDAGQAFKIHDSVATGLGTIVTIRNTDTGRLRIVNLSRVIDLVEGTA